MNTLCITGALDSYNSRVGDILYQAGLAQPVPSRREASIDIYSWHHHTTTAADGSTHTQAEQIVPGRLWEQIAGDIFLANIAQSNWGWADSRSLAFLDFWLRFEPALRFVLVCVEPALMLADVMHDKSAPFEPASTLDHWHAMHRTMLRFHLRHPERCLLIDGAEALDCPSSLIDICQRQWDIPLETATNEIPVIKPHNTLAIHISRQLCIQYSTQTALQRELFAAMTPLCRKIEQEISDLGMPVEAAVQEFRRLLATEELSAEITAYKKHAETLALEKNSLEASLADALSRAGQLQKTQKQTEEENELLLLQLHQVQEELGQTFSQRQLIQSEKKKLEKNIDELRNQKTSAEEAHKKNNQQIAQLQTQKNDLQKTIDELRNQKKSAEEENELLLLQLHQVQEELEQYFYQHQEARKEVADWAERWQRMLTRYPDFQDYTSVSCTRTEDNTLSWCIEGLILGDTTHERIEFMLIHHEDMARFVFSKENKTLTYWPDTAQDQKNLTLPSLDQQKNKSDAEQIFKDLGTTDWSLIHALPNLLAEVLRAPQNIGLSEIEAEPWIMALAATKDRLNQFDRWPRFDSATLKSAQHRQGYEHLELELSNFRLSGRLSPSFVFRVACSNITSERFGSHPSLAFPTSTQTMFENWFEESCDEWGPKLELRFALPQDMDGLVWNRLSAHDHLLIVALLKWLPRLLDNIDHKRLARPVDAWKNMTVQTLNTLKQVVNGLATQTRPIPKSVANSSNLAGLLAHARKLQAGGQR